MDVPDWIKKENWNYWIQEARKEAEKSPCLRMKFGSIIIKEGKELGRGHNRPPYEACEECMREVGRIPPRIRAEACYAFHAEQWATVNALKKGNDVEGSVLVIAGFNPKKSGTVIYNRFTCTLCSRTIAAAGVMGMIALGPEGPKYKTTRQAFDEAYAVQEEIVRNGIKTEDGLEKLLKKRK